MRSARIPRRIDDISAHPSGAKAGTLKHQYAEVDNAETFKSVASHTPAKLVRNAGSLIGSSDISAARRLMCLLGRGVWGLGREGQSVIKAETLKFRNGRHLLLTFQHLSVTAFSKVKNFFVTFYRTEMQLDENILSRDEYQKALRGKRHGKDGAPPRRSVNADVGFVS
jgi:hypothetical protein